MHLSTHFVLASGLLTAVSAVDVDFFGESDNACYTSAFATCYDIQPGDCCTWNGPSSQGYFGSIRISGLSGTSAAGVYNGGAGGCYNNPCKVSTESNCLSCNNQAINGAKWATASSGGGPRRPGVASLPQLGPGGRRVGARPRTGRRSLDSDARPPPSGNVGAVPQYSNNVGASRRPQNIGATRRPQNIGATPRDPLQNLLDQLKGDTPPPAYNDGDYDNQQPYYGNDGNYNNIYTGSSDNTVGATKNSPWKGFFDQLKTWGSSLWDSSKQKRAVGRTVSPNRATIEGHNFNLEVMPTEQQSEMFTAIFNRTQYQHLAKGLLLFEISQ